MLTGNLSTTSENRSNDLPLKTSSLIKSMSILIISIWLPKVLILYDCILKPTLDESAIRSIVSCVYKLTPLTWRYLNFFHSLYHIEVCFIHFHITIDITRN